MLQMLEKTRLLERFDADGSGWLDAGERAKAREHHLASDIGQRRARHFGMRLPAGKKVAAPIEPDSAARYPKRAMFDPDVVRTLFLTLEGDDWFQELADFYRTDVDVPATLVVDGERYRGVGVRFRGSSSYLMTRHTRKKSLNLSIDLVHRKQRLYGQRTLNLLNANSDPSMLREFLFSRIGREYCPMPRVNFVKLVINGESFGVYVCAQQFNRDFVADQFGTRDGVRWKIERNFGGIGALCYLGDAPGQYDRTFLPKGGDRDAMKRLIRLCRLLDETPPAAAERVLPQVLDVDRALWFIALENAFMDADGYVRQGYDYRLYEDPAGRFHPIPYDNNECLPVYRMPQRMRSGQIALDVATSPLAQADNPERPLVHRLLAVPAWRARYLAHLKTIIETWFDWERIGPICKRYHALIDADVRADDKKLMPYEAFGQSLEGTYQRGRREMRSIRALVEGRRAAVLGHEAMAGPWPVISAVEARWEGGRLLVTASVAGKAKLDGVVLWCRSGASYTPLAMRDDGEHGDGAAGDGLWGVTTPVAGERRVELYVEARAVSAHGTTAFHPAQAEAAPLLK